MNQEQAYRRETKRYVIGALAAAVTTGVVYIAAVDGWFGEPWKLAVFALLFALLQLAIQLWTFLHLGEEKKPRWQTQSFLFAFAMAVVIVVGSIWIMMNLNYNMGMSPVQMEEYMMKQNKKGF